MTRKSRDKTSNWTPTPECAAAYARAIETAHLAAASLCGEKPVADPARKASPRVLFHAMGMMFFLARLDPRDMAALFTGPGSFADFDHKPLPLNRWPKKSVLDEFMQ